MKLIVAGSRTVTNEKRVHLALTRLHSIFNFREIVCGEAKGPDLFGRSWGEEAGIPVKSFPADWEGLGKRAGYVRNEQMVEYADGLVAFWDGESKGTKHTINLAIENGLVVTVFRVKTVAT